MPSGSLGLPSRMAKPATAVQNHSDRARNSGASRTRTTASSRVDAAERHGVEGRLPARHAHIDRRQGDDPAAQGHVVDQSRGARHRLARSPAAGPAWSAASLDFDGFPPLNDLIERHARGGGTSKRAERSLISSDLGLSGEPGSLRAFRRPAPFAPSRGPVGGKPLRRLQMDPQTVRKPAESRRRHIE